jgi:hypothetical protein
MTHGRRCRQSMILLSNCGQGGAAPMGGAGGGGQGLLVDTATATGDGRGRQRRAAKAVAEGEEQCQNDVWCVLYSTLLGKA